MRTTVVLAAAALTLALAAYAYAQAQTNTYEVTASTTPSKAGSKSKPVPVGLSFDYTVAEANGNRPAPVKQYSIRFAGLRVNPGAAATCSAAKLEESGPTACPSKSIVGTGFIEAFTGATANPADKSIRCNAALSVVNHGKMKASIYIQGGPNETDQRKKCAIDLAAPISATFRNGSVGSMNFTVPSSLLHPGGPTISNAVVRTRSAIKRISKNGRGFFEAVGGCKRGRRAISVVFTAESAAPKTQKSTARCS